MDLFFELSRTIPDTKTTKIHTNGCSNEKYQISSAMIPEAPRSRGEPLEIYPSNADKSTVSNLETIDSRPDFTWNAFSKHDVHIAERIARKPWRMASMADCQLERNRVLASLGTCVTWNCAIIFPLWHEGALQPREDFLQPGA